MRGRAGSHVVAVAAASAATLLRRCRRHWLRFGHTTIQSYLALFHFFFFWKCIRFALGQYLPTTTTKTTTTWDKCQNLNWFIAVLKFFLEQTGSLIWSLSTGDCAASDSSASAVGAARKLQRLEVIKRSNWEWGFYRCQGYCRACKDTRNSLRQETNDKASHWTCLTAHCICNPPVDSFLSLSLSLFFLPLSFLFLQS